MRQLFIIIPVPLFMKKLVALLIISILVLIISFTYIGRYIFWNFADINDYKKFPFITVHRGGEIFRFQQYNKPAAFKLPAKFARLYLNEGNWEGNQIISRDWIRHSISINNDSWDSQGYPCNYHWRVLEDGSFFAKGILGQYIYVDPSRDLIMLRFGKKAGDVEWIEFSRDLVKQL
jgi:hypothetical protein